MKYNKGENSFMLRTDVIQALLNKRKRPAYLEIGVQSGRNFFAVKNVYKTAVDPKFTFSFRDRLRWVLRNPSNLFAKYYQVTSNKYFEIVDMSKKKDVVFIDGLHTYAQSLMDVINSLNVLEENGVIVMHDCNPPHKIAAYPAQTIEEAARANATDWTYEWCGDVWKTICFLRSTRSDLRVFVLDTDYGLGIITRMKADECLGLSPEQIDAMTYDDLEKNRVELLGLKHKEYFFDFLKDIALN
jgi:hypothetical protein